MRTFVMSVVMGLVVLAWSGMARAQEASANSGVAVANNMQWHNNHWWYYSNGQWLVHHENQWFAPGPDGQYRYADGRPIFGAQASTGVRYQSGYRSNPNYNYNYGNAQYDRYGNPYYGNNPYGNRYGNYGYGNNYGYGANYGYGNRNYGGGSYNSGSAAGAAIGGALGGRQGAAAGAIIGGAINR